MENASPMRADMSWHAVLEHHAVRTPHKPLAIFGNETVTYGEMATRAARLAAGLRDRGVKSGDVVGLLSYNCTEFLETIFAANVLGAIAMPINWRLAAPELRYILEHSEARALVCDESLVDLANAAITGMERDLVTVCVARPAPDGWTSLAELRAGSSLAERRTSRTSSSSGSPAPTSDSRAGRCITSVRSTSRPPRSSRRARRRSSIACSTRPTSSTRSSVRA